MTFTESEDKCKYLLHFKTNSITAVRVENDGKEDILSYANSVFGDLCGLKFNHISSLVVITRSEVATGIFSNIFMSFVPEQMTVEVDNILCLCPDRRVNDLKLDSCIKGLNFKGLSIPEIESHFATSVIPFHRINQIDWFTKQFGIKPTLGVK